MTQRLYLHSDDLHMNATVTGCVPAEDGSWHVVLSATLFHPQGGGQPSDIGTIGEANVIRVIQAETDVLHVCDRAVPVGPTSISVSSSHRDLHARLHSAGHLIGYCGELLGWRAVKAHHWPGEARVVFERSDDAKPMTPESIEQHVNAQVAADLPRHVSQQGDVRKIAFGEQTAYRCGGTHVATSRDVGRVVIAKVKEKKGELSVHYTIDVL